MKIFNTEKREIDKITFQPETKEEAFTLWEFRKRLIDSMYEAWHFKLVSALVITAIFSFLVGAGWALYFL